MRKLVCYVDMDNTLLDTGRGAVEYAKKITGNEFLTFDVEKNLVSTHTNHWLEKSGMTVDDSVEMRLRLFHDVWYWETIPFIDEWAYDVFKWLHENHEVYIATSVFHTNSEECYVGKPRWIKRNLPFFPVGRLIYSHMKYNLIGDVIIEDAPTQVIKFPGVPILFDRPYNRPGEIYDGYVVEDKFIRVKNWKEIKETLEKM